MKNIIRRYTCYLALLTVALLQPICISAQEIETKTVLTGTENQPSVFVDNVHYATVGAKLNIGVSFTLPTLDADTQKNPKVNSCNVIFNGETKAVTLNDSNTGTVEFDITSTMEKQEATVLVEYSYEQIKSDSTWEAISEKKEISSETVTIFNKPSIKTAPTTEKQYITKDSYAVSIAGQDGYSSGWKYYLNDATSSGSIEIKKPANLPDDGSYKITAKNFAPDNSTVWFTNDYTCPVYFYDEPSASKSSDSETETCFYKNTGKSVWGITTTGGDPNSWTITWTGGQKNQSGSATTYSPFSSDVTDNQTDKVITAQVVNKAQDGHVLYNSTITFPSINIYKAISHKAGTTTKSIYTGEEVKFALESANGGYPNGWTYSWSNGKSNGSSVTDNPSSNAEYVLTATNKYNGVEWDKFTETYSVTVYSQPNATATESITAFNLNTGDTRSTTLTTDLTYSNKMVTPRDYGLVKGDYVNISLDPNNGVSNGWTYQISENGTVRSSNSDYKFTPKSAGTYTIVISTKNGEGVVQTPYTATITRKYIVYDTPSIDATEKSINTYGGKSYTFNATTQAISGGHAEGWSYKWNDGTTDKSKTITTDETITSKQTYKYSFTGIYTCEGFERFSGGKTFNLIAWPKPKITGLTIKLRDKDINTVKNITYYDLASETSEIINIDCYKGDYIDIAYNVSGGYADDTSGWTYTATNGTSKLVPINNYSTVVGNGSDYISNTLDATTSSYRQSYTIELSNKVNSTVETTTASKTWLTKSLMLYVRTWQTPSITDNTKDSIALNSNFNTSSWKNCNRVNVYAGGEDVNNVDFNISHAYGYTENNGWSYVWKEDGSISSTQDTKWTYLPSADSNYVDKTFTVDIANKIGDNYGLKESKIYFARVWKKAEIDDGFTLTDNNQGRRMTENILAVRSGNTINIAVSPTQYGYNGKNYYNWTDGTINTSNNITNWTWTASATNNELAKGTSTGTIALNNYNMGPYGRIWNGQKSNQEITIYNRPQTPESLMIKGSGTSGTMICTTTVSDDDLEDKEYYLVFGYTDNSGDHDIATQQQRNSGQVRWSKGFSLDNMSNGYVYAKWIYSDNVSITSGKRYVNSVDESWDGSTYSASTRSSIFSPYYDPTPVEQVYADTENDDSISDSNSTVRIFSMDGQLMTSKSALPQGIYIRESVCGNKKNITKFVVK